MTNKFAFLFPGQGAQYIGMGKDFFEQFSEAKETFHQADEILNRSLSGLIFSGQESELVQTKNSQPAIFVTSIALLRVLNKLFPEVTPHAVAGLSLGEYSALVAGSYIEFAKALPLVQMRGELMHDACEHTEGTMAVVLGLEDDVVEACVQELGMPKDLWSANFNCPGQVVISGTRKGVEAGSQALLQKGAKRVMPLQVHGAFHSGLMSEARERLKPYLVKAEFNDKAPAKIAMNVTGSFPAGVDEIRSLLIDQVTHPVRWSKCVRSIDSLEPTVYIEIGCGKTLAGMNKRIGPKAPTVTLEKVEDLSSIEKILNS